MLPVAPNTDQWKSLVYKQTACVQYLKSEKQKPWKSEHVLSLLKEFFFLNAHVLGYYAIMLLSQVHH